MIRSSAIAILLAFVGNSGLSQLGGTDELRDSLKHELKIAKVDTTRVLIMAAIGNAYIENQSDSVVKYGALAMALAEKVKFTRGELSALDVLGTGLQLTGDYPKSLEYLYRGLEIGRRNKYAFETAVCYEWIGSAYWFLADYSKSVDFYQKSKSLFNTIINEPNVVQWINFNILSIGQAYLDWNQLDSAYHYLSRYYNIELRDEIWHPAALYLLGDCLFKRGDRNLSFNYLRESITKSTIDRDYFTQVEACAAISRFFKTTNQFDSSISYAKRGLIAADSFDYKLGTYKNSKLLAEDYEQLNADQALHYRKLYDSVNESMYGAKKVQDLQKTLAEEQHRQQQLQDEQIQKETRLKQYGFIGGLVILLFVAFILYRNNLQKKRTNVLVQHQKEKVESTLQELRSTQAQLIQSEKMASLGELTAGIAHEIQNPLNFVNNFSEVNRELIEELEGERSKVRSERNEEAETAIIRDIKDNEEKINHHGKRADAIVKGMLQHSRTSSGQKEPTNINRLADEYLRLAYQGFCARDKSFNAAFSTEFDNGLGNVNIVPQDIGRAILNLINNAFYSANERAKQGIPGYEPTVIVGTRRLQDRIEIRVKDNGNGIPASIKEKIFQPFFTTKPTGQGTGLGLSLAYDIVKAHGGDIKVETKEEEGSEFIIRLPANSSIL